jgi:hypothetical protein
MLDLRLRLWLLFRLLWLLGLMLRLLRLLVLLMRLLMLLPGATSGLTRLLLLLLSKQGGILVRACCSCNARGKPTLAISRTSSRVHGRSLRYHKTRQVFGGQMPDLFGREVGILCPKLCLKLCNLSGDAWWEYLLRPWGY